MSELLRAVLDQSCTFSAPAFYTVEHKFPSGTLRNIPQTQYLETKVDRIFLVTSLSFAQFGISNGVTVIAPSAAYYKITMLRSSRVLFDKPILNNLLGGDERLVFTLPEYIMFESNDTIAVEVVPVADAGIEGKNFVLTFNGIEYGK